MFICAISLTKDCILFAASFPDLPCSQATFSGLTEEIEEEIGLFLAPRTGKIKDIQNGNYASTTQITTSMHSQEDTCATTTPTDRSAYRVIGT